MVEETKETVSQKTSETKISGWSWVISIISIISAVIVVLIGGEIKNKDINMPNGAIYTIEEFSISEGLIDIITKDCASLKVGDKCTVDGGRFVLVYKQKGTEKTTSEIAPLEKPDTETKKVEEPKPDKEVIVSDVDVAEVKEVKEVKVEDNKTTK